MPAPVLLAPCVVLRFAQGIDDLVRGVVDPTALEEPAGVDRHLGGERELHGTSIAQEAGNVITWVLQFSECFP